MNGDGQRIVRWEIQLDGDTSYLRTLCLSFTTDPEVLERDGQFFASFVDLTVIADQGQVVEEAKERIAYLSGCAALLGCTDPVRYVGIEGVRADGTRVTIVTPEPARILWRALPGSVTISNPDGSVQTYHPADPCVRWLQRAATDPVVRAVLRLRSRGNLEPVELGILLEEVQSAIGAIDERGWASENQRHGAAGMDGLPEPQGGLPACRSRDDVPRPPEPTRIAPG